MTDCQSISVQINKALIVYIYFPIWTPKLLAGWLRLCQASVTVQLLLLHSPVSHPLFYRWSSLNYALSHSVLSSASREWNLKWCLTHTNLIVESLSPPQRQETKPSEFSPVSPLMRCFKLVSLSSLVTFHSQNTHPTPPFPPTIKASNNFGFSQQSLTSLCPLWHVLLLKMP